MTVAVGETSQVLDVLIVGAGPTGLTLACELARRGISYRLIDVSEAPRPGSRGKGLQPRTLEVFDDLGIVDQILANGQMAMPIVAYAPDGTRTVNEPQVELRPDVPYPTSLITPQWRVEEALRGRLASLGGSVEFGWELKSVTQVDQSVSVTLAHAESIEPTTARWLIGCDGAHSVVRKQAGINFEGETLEDVRMIVADVEISGADRTAWHMWRHSEGLAALCPLPSTNLFQFQASIAPGQNANLDAESISAILQRRSGREDLPLSKLEWSSLWRANVRIVDRYRVRRILVAGDAAHVHSAAGGQGMNTGIQDAYNLGWKLAAALKHGRTDLLDTYESERCPVALEVLALSNARLQQTIQNKSISAQRDGTTTQLGINYRNSTLSRDDRDETFGVRAGDRAPDVIGLSTVDGPKRLFDLMRGTHFTVLNFGTALEALDVGPEVHNLHVVDEAVLPHQISDPSGLLSAALEAEEQTLVVIRPDGYIGAIFACGNAEMVSRYLAQFC